MCFQDLADSDAGAYRCAIVNPHGKGNANFNLKLTGPFTSTPLLTTFSFFQDSALRHSLRSPRFPLETMDR